MMCMTFGQLSNRDSLRDLLVCLTAHKTKHYHLGFGKNISRSNLAEANEKRNCDSKKKNKRKIKTKTETETTTTAKTKG